LKRRKLKRLQGKEWKIQSKEKALEINLLRQRDLLK
jgi:hypothetical protein